MSKHAACRAGLTLCLATAFVLPTGAKAWKGPTHVYLAEEVREAMVAAGGLVNVDGTSFWGQQVTGAGAMGSYAASDATYSALASYPAYFRAGALGPDAYADLLFGQNTIHPDANTLGGTDAWLKLLYANANTPQERAFVMGFISHAASDLFGHTFVNSYAGGAFALGPNAVKHVLVEGYVADRTPPLRGSSSYTIETAAVDQFIYENMVDARRGRDGSPTVLWELTRRTRHQTVPGLFTELRAGLEDSIAGYYDHVAYTRGHIRHAEDRCADSWGFDLYSCGEAAALWAYLQVYMGLKGGIVIAYEEAWVDDINRGLRAWPATSTAVARAVFMNPAGADWNSAGAALSAWKDAHLLSMIGLPDVVATIVNAVSEILDLLGPLKYPLAQLERYVLDWLVRQGTGQGIEEWKRYAKGEAADVDQWVPSSTGPPTSAQLDQQMALSGGKFTAARFAPAFNSMSLIRLSLINDGDDWLALLARLGSNIGADLLRQYLQHRFYDPAFLHDSVAPGFDAYGFNPEPWDSTAFFPQSTLTALLGRTGFGYAGQKQPNYQAVVGYIRSLDDSNQWEPRGDGGQLVVTRDYGHFMRLFMHQRGDCHDAGRCAPNPLPAIQAVINLLLE